MFQCVSRRTAVRARFAESSVLRVYYTVNQGTSDEEVRDTSSLESPFDKGGLRGLGQRGGGETPAGVWGVREGLIHQSLYTIPENVGPRLTW